MYYTNDANMNITALVNTSGAVVERYSYDPYGRVTFRKPDYSKTDGPDGQSDTADDGTAGEFANAILYAGYLYDDETGLFHVRNRTYHPTLGRWLQRDPKDAGLPGGGYHDGMNLYAYVKCNPGVHTDPHGEEHKAVTRIAEIVDAAKEAKRIGDAVLDTAEDAQLLAKIIQGDQQAFEDLVEKHGKKAIKGALTKAIAKAGLKSGAGIVAAIAMEGAEVGSAISVQIQNTTLEAHTWNICCQCVMEEGDAPTNAFWWTTVGAERAGGLCFKTSDHEIYGITEGTVKTVLGDYIWPFFTLAEQVQGIPVVV